MNTKKSEEFYKRLKEQLSDSNTWPSNYLYKFIVPTDDTKIKQIQDIFDNTGAVIESKQSKKGTYTSISVTVNLKDPDAVIEKYKEVGRVEGVISL
jgi:putative lipoic acid-binding regulatory protein